MKNKKPEDYLNDIDNRFDIDSFDGDWQEHHLNTDDIEEALRDKGLGSKSKKPEDYLDDIDNRFDIDSFDGDWQELINTDGIKEARRDKGLESKSELGKEPPFSHYCKTEGTAQKYADNVKKVLSTISGKGLKNKSKSPLHRK